jgi:hypothetical protein
MPKYQDTDFQSYGQSQISNGLYTRDGISGAGLITRGFIYGVYDVYIDEQGLNPITTSWAVGSSVASTSWAVGSSVSSTTWNNEYLGIYGDSIWS